MSDLNINEKKLNEGLEKIEDDNNSLKISLIKFYKQNRSYLPAVFTLIFLIIVVSYVLWVVNLFWENLILVKIMALILLILTVIPINVMMRNFSK